MKRSVIFSCIITLCLALAISRPVPAVAAEAPIEQGGTTAFINVNLVPMIDETILTNQVLLVQGTKIAAFGPAGTVKIPEDTALIDGQGGWLMPGLADMHMHTLPEWLTDAWPVNPLVLFLINGVTTIRCLGPDLGSRINSVYVLNWRKLIAQGLMDGPTIYTCGSILAGPVKDPAGTVLRQKADGYDFIKIYSYLTPEEFEIIMNTAHEQGMFVVGHVPMMVGLEKALAGGQDEIAHVEELAWEMTPFDRSRRDLKGREWIMYVALELYKRYQNELSLSLEEIKTKYRGKLLALADEVKRAGVPVSTTLFLDELIVQKLNHPAEFLNRPEIKLMPRAYLNDFHQGREKHQIQFKGGYDFTPFKRNLDLALLWALKEKGVPVLLATDTGTGRMGIVPGYTIHDELKVLVENGYTPYEALASGTIGASRAMARITGRDEFGVIAPGKRADLLLVGGNPLDDVTRAKDIKGVMASGRWYDAEFVQSGGKSKK